MTMNILTSSVQDMEAMFTSHDTGRKGTLDYEDVQKLNASLFKKYARLQPEAGERKTSGMVSKSSEI